MEILELPSLKPRLNITTYRTPPTFLARGLDDATSYRIMLYAVNAKGKSDPMIIDPVTFKGVAKLQGPTAAIPINPLILILLGTAALLATGVCLVLAALCRRHFSHRHQLHRPIETAKHVPMEAVIASDDILVNSSILGATQHHEQQLTIETFRDGTDPDIIRNQYERRPPTHGFMKVYEPPGTREEVELEDDGEEYDFKQVAKDTHIPSNNAIYRSLQRPNRTAGLAPLPGSQTLTQKYRGPEVVTTSNRIQESCI